MSNNPFMNFTTIAKYDYYCSKGTFVYLLQRLCLIRLLLTHISLALLFGDIGKQCSQIRCRKTRRLQMPQNAMSNQGLHCLLTGISIKNKIKWKSTPDTPKMTNGLVQYIRIE